MANEAENPEGSEDAVESVTDTPVADEAAESSVKASAAETKPVAKKKAAAKKPTARKAAANKKPAAKASVAAARPMLKKPGVKGLAEVLAESAKVELPEPVENVGDEVAISVEPALAPGRKTLGVKAITTKPKSAAKDAKKGANEYGNGPAASASFLRRVGKRDVTDFLRQLIMLLKAGTPILRSLQTLSKRSQNPNARALVADITQYVEAGNPLWQAFDRHSRYFDRVFVNLIRASEASGTLTTVLERVVSYRAERELMTKRVRGAMVYPVILIFVITLVTLLISWWVIPEFKGMFEQAGIEVASYTKFLFAISEVFKYYFWVPFAVVLVLIIAYKYFVSSMPAARYWVDTLRLRIPVIGLIVKGGAIVEMTRTLAMLIRSGVPMMATLELTRSSVGNMRIAKALQDVRDSVERGGGMEAPLRKAAPAIPHVVTDMLVTGEESGKVDEVANQIADIYEQEVAIQAQSLGETLQPIFTVIVAFGVLVLFVSLFSPILDLINQLTTAGA